MDTPKHHDMGIWPHLLCALGCLTFMYRGLVALVDRQDRMLEGGIFLATGVVASIFVAHAIWKLAHESKHSDESSQFDSAHASRSMGTED